MGQLDSNLHSPHQERERGARRRQLTGGAVGGQYQIREADPLHRGQARAHDPAARQRLTQRTHRGVDRPTAAAPDPAGRR
jgi:hypothetical protein